MRFIYEYECDLCLEFRKCFQYLADAHKLEAFPCGNDSLVEIETKPVMLGFFVAIRDFKKPPLLMIRRYHDE